MNQKFAKSNYKGPIGKLAFLVLIKCFRSIVTVSVSGKLHFVLSDESGITSSVIWYITFLVNFNFIVITLVNIRVMAVVQHFHLLGALVAFTLLHSLFLYLCVTYITPKVIIFTIYYPILFLFITRKSFPTTNSGDLHFVYDTQNRRKILRGKG